jgi:ribose 5-phosphate isomerase B
MKISKINPDLALKIGIASDHAGYQLKSAIIAELKAVNLIDYGCDSEASVDYPDFAQKLAAKISAKEIDLGILICGSGIGISIAANRFQGVRAALCHNIKTTKLARQHNDANILCLGARIVKKDLAIKCVKYFLATKFAGGRHEMRLKKIDR